MFGGLMNLFSLCWRPFGGDKDGGGREGREGLLWYRDIGRYSCGDFSMAVVQANQVLEDQSQIESGPFGTFVGVYDGHGGPEAARYVCDHLFRNFRDMSSEARGVTPETIQRAFLETEEGFSTLVSEQWPARPHMATVGSCCLVGVICQGTLYVANLGDSRVVLGTKVGNTGGIAAIQLSAEHNANLDEVRHELKELHPNDPQIVVLKHGVWRVKGIIQVSRSIGDLYMKNARYNREPLNGKFRISEPVNMPILSANPSIISHTLKPNDSFLIFASDGLWEHLSNEKAVDIVNSHPHAGKPASGECGPFCSVGKSSNLRVLLLPHQLMLHPHQLKELLVIHLSHLSIQMLIKLKRRAPSLVFPPNTLQHVGLLPRTALQLQTLTGLSRPSIINTSQ